MQTQQGIYLAVVTSYKYFIIQTLRVHSLLFCQPRVDVTSCFVYKVMGLTFHDSIKTQLMYRFELAQVVARRITKQQRNFLGSNLTGCSSFIQCVFSGGGGGKGADFIFLFMSFSFFLFFYFLFFIFFIPCEMAKSLCCLLINRLIMP